MPKHAAPIVVRVWADGYRVRPVNALVRDWDRGGFTLSTDHPAARVLWARLHHNADLVVTVLDTDELEWRVATMSTGIGEYAGRYIIQCEPRRDQLRAVLERDERLIELGLVS